MEVRIQPLIITNWLANLVVGAYRYIYIYIYIYVFIPMSNNHCQQMLKFIYSLNVWLYLNLHFNLKFRFD